MTIPKIGELVRLNLSQIIQHCETVDPEELGNLTNWEYSNQRFGLGWPFFKTPTRVLQDDEHQRYWVDEHQVLDLRFRATSQWYERHRAPFLFYLEDKGLTPLGLEPAEVDAEVIELTQPKPALTFAPGGSRYKNHPIGNAQNSIVRTVLGNLGQESFTAHDWFAAKEAFDNECVYCGSPRQLVMDHAVPISRVALGEHRLGNLVPACKSCNAAKADKRYDEFLLALPDRDDAANRISAIEKHMVTHRYEPLVDVLDPATVERIRNVLNDVRQQVVEAANQAVNTINAERGSL